MNNFKDQSLCNKHKREGNILESGLSKSQNQILCKRCVEEQYQTKDSLTYQFREQQLNQIKTQTFMINQAEKPFQYKLEAKCTTKQDENCYAIEINEDMTLMIAGCNSLIKIYQFDQGSLREIQILESHTDNVHKIGKYFINSWNFIGYYQMLFSFQIWKFYYKNQTNFDQLTITTLSFMSKSNDIISGSDDKQIIIWQYDKKYLWKISKKIIGHSGQINCVIRNNNDDLIISCSWDKTIKFWTKQNQWECFQTISEHTSTVFQLSLNLTQNKLISCGIDQFILVMEFKSSDQKWIVIKKIWTSLQGNRLCFLSDQLFAFQPDNKEITQVYEINNTKKQYEKKNEIVVQGNYDGSILFPQKFIKEKQLLVNKYYTFVNLLKLDKDGKLLSKFTIEFNTYGIFGTISPNGEYLVTWNYKTKEIEVRKYHN